jgi:gamma-glutamyltranspeptidase/glutathione hydrolase
MVVAGHPLASLAGIMALQRGGNAVDAAIAVAAALNVVEPQMSGIGGDGYLMIYHRGRNTVEVVNATGAAPLAATAEEYQGGIPMKGIRSVSVPGLLDGWMEAHARHGRLRLPDLFAPAIGWADNGFPISQRLAENIAADPALISTPSSRVIFAPEGRPLKAGEVLYQHDLARTFARLAREGADVFYRGDIAAALARCSEANGGLLTLRDLAQHRTRWQEPISTAYHDYTVFEAPPNSSGIVLLQMLNLIEAFDLSRYEWNSAASIHLMVEAKKLAFADREQFLADPEWVEVPVEGLLRKEYARERATLIAPDRAAAAVEPGDPWRYQPRGRPSSVRRRGGETPAREDTTCFVVVDGEGSAVSALQSLQSAFGSTLVAEGTGILLNNRMTYWHLNADHVDCLEPGKRVRHTMNPVMAFRDGKLRLVFGTPGADTQTQTNLQVFTHVVDFGLSVQEAVEAPRWRHLQSPTESAVPHRCEDQLQIEGRFGAPVAEGLTARGHRVVKIGDWAGVGSQVMIAVDPEAGVLQGGADPRRDAYAIGC